MTARASSTAPALRLGSAAAARSLKVWAGGVAAVALAVAVVICWPLVRHIASALPGNLGDPLLNAWILGWTSERAAAFFQGVWHAPVFHPHDHALAYSEHLLGIAALVAPIEWISDNPVLTYNAAYLLSFAHAALGAFLLAHELTRRRLAAAAAGFLFAFCMYRVASQHTFLQFQMCGWLPLGLWALLRFLRGGRWSYAAVFVGALVAQAYTSPYFVYLMGLPAALMSAWMLYARRDARRLIGPLVGMAIAAAALVAPSALVYRDVQAEMSFSRTEQENALYSARLDSYLSPFTDQVRWSILPREKTAVRALFPGLALSLAAAAVLLRRWPRRRRAGRGDASRLAWVRRGGAVAMAVAACVVVVAGLVDLPIPLANAAIIVLTIGLLTPPRSAAGGVARLTGLMCLLSLGPHPYVLGEPFASTGPYEWLSAVAPGLSGFRAPARFGLVVMLGLSLLAAFAVRRLTPSHAPRHAALLLGSLAALCAYEITGFTMTARSLDIAGRPSERDAYAWLRDQPPGALVNLPIGDEDFATPEHANASTTLFYVHGYFVHRKPLVNGATDFQPPFARFLSGDTSPLRMLDDIPAGLDMLRAMGVRYVAVHHDDFKEPRFMRLTLEALSAAADQITERRTIGDVTVFVLRDRQRLDWVDAAGRGYRQVPSSAISVSASQMVDRADETVDGDINTRWFTNRRQVGAEWIEAALAQPADIGAIRLDLHPSLLGDFPRRLAVDVISSDGRVERVRDDHVLTELGWGLIREPQSISMTIALPHNRASRLRLAQTGRTRSWHWSVNELTLWERTSENDLTP